VIQVRLSRKKALVKGVRTMSRKTHHVVPDGDGGWNVKKGGSSRASGNFDLKQDAIDRAREISRNQGSELVIHNRDGKISGSDSHGNDPCPPKDKH
jgi:hypothetical protein